MSVPTIFRALGLSLALLVAGIAVVWGPAEGEGAEPSPRLTAYLMTLPEDVGVSRVDESTIITIPMNHPQREVLMRRFNAIFGSALPDPVGEDPGVETSPVLEPTFLELILNCSQSAQAVATGTVAPGFGTFDAIYHRIPPAVGTLHMPLSEFFPDGSVFLQVADPILGWRLHKLTLDWSSFAKYSGGQCI